MVLDKLHNVMSHIHHLDQSVNVQVVFEANGSSYSCVFGKRNYRVLVRVCVCVCVFVCVCFCTITQKEIDLGTRNWNTL